MDAARCVGNSCKVRRNQSEQLRGQVVVVVVVRTCGQGQVVYYVMQEVD